MGAEQPVWLSELTDAANAEQLVDVWARQLRAGHLPRSRELLVQELNQYVAAIDAIVTRQVNVIIHQPRFQQLEASWRGLHYLVTQMPEEANVKVRLLSVSWKTLVRDLEKAIEFDHSQLFIKVYCDEFGISGGEPFSVLLGDYEIRLGPRPGTTIDDLDAMARISEVAAAAFAPFITMAHPSLLSLDRFAELERPQDIERIFQQPELLKWRTLRQRDDSRFLGIALPRVLMRKPYADDGSLRSNFRFVEDAATLGSEGYLWGSPIYAYGAVLMQAFHETGWLSEIRGVRQDMESCGLLPGLVAPSFETDAEGLVFKGALDVMIPDILEPDLVEQGFLPICRCQDTEHAAFYSSSSIQRAKMYDDPLATANARIGSLLQYILCVSRFAHYVKVLGRDKIGSFAEPGDVSKFLNQWIRQYVSSSTDRSAAERARFPLRQAQVEVRELPGKPGSYGCAIYMEPYLQFDRVAAGIRLTTELAQVAQ
jgi:type VI secretion system ImpC/EvpB family protein